MLGQAFNALHSPLSYMNNELDEMNDGRRRSMSLDKMQTDKQIIMQHFWNNESIERTTI